jgi:mRNA-degrading endonuclease RelE of RelBE toxin-antitoxin system
MEMDSHTVKSYWKAYNILPEEIRKKAEKKFELWKENPFHPSLRFKCVNAEENIWSVRISPAYRALGVKTGNTIIWFWIGDHDRYEQLL